MQQRLSSFIRISLMFVKSNYSSIVWKSTGTNTYDTSIRLGVHLLLKYKKVFINYANATSRGRLSSNHSESVQNQMQNKRYVVFTSYSKKIWETTLNSILCRSCELETVLNAARPFSRVVIKYIFAHLSSVLLQPENVDLSRRLQDE